MRTDSNAATHTSRSGDTPTQPHASKSRWPLFCGTYAFGDPIRTIGEQAPQWLGSLLPYCPYLPAKCRWLPISVTRLGKRRWIWIRVTAFGCAQLCVICCGLVSVLGHQMHMRHKTAATSIWMHVAALSVRIVSYITYSISSCNCRSFILTIFQCSAYIATQLL